MRSSLCQAFNTHTERAPHLKEGIDTRPVNETGLLLHAARQTVPTSQVKLERNLFCSGLLQEIEAQRLHHAWVQINNSYYLFEWKKKKVKIGPMLYKLLKGVQTGITPWRGIWQCYCWNYKARKIAANNGLIFSKCLEKITVNLEFST